MANQISFYLHLTIINNIIKAIITIKAIIFITTITIIIIIIIIIIVIAYNLGNLPADDPDGSI